MKRALFTILTVLIGVVAVGGSVLWFHKIQTEPATLTATLTGETVQIKATKLPKFRPGAEFKAVVSGAKKTAAPKKAAKNMTSLPSQTIVPTATVLGRVTVT